MKLRALLMILLLGFGWMLNSLEDHLCSDTGSAEIVPAGSEDFSASFVALEATPESESDRHGELCHFGHCSHGNRFGASDGFVLPTLISLSASFFPYAASLLIGESYSNLRPPAFA